MATPDDSLPQRQDQGYAWLLATPLLAVGGALTGTSWVTTIWDRCPLATDGPDRVGLAFVTMPAVWLAMTVVLLLLQVVLRAAVPRTFYESFRWGFVILSLFGLVLLYRHGMGTPEFTSAGDCKSLIGWPVFPYVWTNA